MPRLLPLLSLPSLLSPLSLFPRTDPPASSASSVSSPVGVPGRSGPRGRMRLSLLAAAAVTLVATSLAPAAASSSGPVTVLDYTALGDSYSANAYVRPWATEDGCGRSAQSYPQQTARRLRLRLTDVTCSAAEVRAGLLERQTVLKGPPSVPPRGGWAAKPAQIGAVSATTDLVTVGIGGNSVGFADIVQQCIERGLVSFGLGSPCSAHYGRGPAATSLEGRFTALGADLSTLLREIRSRAPGARVAVVGYPAVVADSAGCRWGAWHQFGTVTKGDMRWLDSLERRVNTVLREQAGRSGAAYVDTYTPSKGHGVCAGAGERWMYGIKDTLTGPGDQGDSPSDLCRSIPAQGDACTVLHPNLTGATRQADAVVRALTEPQPGAGAVR